MGAVRVYPAADLAAYEATAAVLDQLQTLLADRPDQPPLARRWRKRLTLPFLPVLPAGQAIRARAEQCRQPGAVRHPLRDRLQRGGGAVLADAFVYTFLGLQRRRRHGRLRDHQPERSRVPRRAEPIDDLGAFVDRLPEYLAESTARLNEAAPESFTPSLALADALVESLAFDS